MLAFPICNGSIVTAIVAITVLALIYTTMGGMLAVIWTDVLQAIVLLVGALVIMGALLLHMPAPVPDVLRDLKDEKQVSRTAAKPKQ
jgi:SSS family solute:Na+ symporter